jgi:hypothetical protein
LEALLPIAASVLDTEVGGFRKLRPLMPAGPLKEWFPPGAVVRVPIDGGVEAFLEVVERFPL